GYDSDVDGIADIAEKEEGKYLYECERMVSIDKVYENGAIQMEEGDDRIVSIEIPVTEDTSTYDFSLAIRARYYDKGEQEPAFRVELGEPTPYLQETFKVKEDYEWYQTSWFTLSSGSTVIGKIVDVNGGGEVVVDKYLLLKKGSNENPPILSSPLIADMDEDGLLDGYERRPAGFYIEAEHYGVEHNGVGSYYIVDSTDCSNSKYIKATGTDEFVKFNIYTSGTSTENYDIYVRAGKVDEDQNAQFSITVDDTTKYKTVGSAEFKWYQFSFSLSGSTSYECTITDTTDGGSVQNVKIDRILVVRVKDVEYVKEYSGSEGTLTFTEGEEKTVSGIEVPLWANVLNATILYTSTSVDTDTGITTSSDIQYLDVWGNMTAYAYGNSLKVYNMSTGITYDLTDPSGSTIENPSLQNNEIVYTTIYPGDSLYHFLVKYSDLRKDKDHISIVTLKEYTSSERGTYPVIYDGIVAWKVPEENKIECYLLDSDETITIEESSGTIKERISLYEQTVAWIVSGTDYSAVRVAFIGELADKQENMVEYAGLSPHIKTILQTYTSNAYSQVSIYGTKVAVMCSDGRILLYDLVSESSSQLYTSTNLDLGSRIILRGDYLVWGESDGVYLKELGTGSQSAVGPITTSNVYALYGGKVYYADNSDTNIKKVKCYRGGYNFKINQETFYVSDELVMKDRWTPDFSEAINSYLEAERKSSAYADDKEPFVSIPLKIKSDYSGTVVLKKILIRYDNLTDPFSDDLDRDGISDGPELLNYYGNSMIEIEDCIDFKEWIDPDSGDGFSSTSTFAKSFYMSSPIFYTEGIDLYTGRMKARTEESGDVYVNTASSLRYSLDGIKHPGLYGIRIVKNDKFDEMLGESYPFRPFPQKYGRLDDAEMAGGYPDGFDNRISVGKSLGEEEYEYLQEVLSYVISVKVCGTSGEEVKKLNENKEFRILASYVGREISIPLEYYDENARNSEMSLIVEMNYTAILNFGGASGYILEISCDLDNLPDRLNPGLKDTLGDKSDVPDNLDIDRFFLIRLTNMDYIQTFARGSLSISSDTDNDRLDDLSELEVNEGFLWNKDADRDGVSDGDEVNNYYTLGYRRDSDGDGIRDSVELSIPSSNLCTLESPGSWYERRLRNGDYFDFSPISNEDLDLSTSTNPLDEDTDDDGLPDGWIDGWYYWGGYYGYYYYGGPWVNYYVEDKWGRGITYNDGIIQVYEGEDFDLDGAVDGTMSSWDFDGVTYEFKGSGSKETNPNVKDTDNDQMPDGYEIWYAIKEPLVDDTGELILDPTNPNDAAKDLDTDSFAVIMEVDGDLTDSAPPERYAQMINIDQSELKKIVRVGVKVAGGEPECIGIWAGTDHSVDNEITVIYDYCEKNEDWYVYDVPQGLFYNGLPDGYYFYVVLYTSGTVKWYYNTNGGDSTFEYRDGTWIWSSNKDMALRVYKCDFNDAGDGLINLEEYTVGTNPKNPNTDNEGESDDHINDCEEVREPVSGTYVKVLARTSVANGMLGFRYFWDAMLTDADYIDYDKEPLTTGNRPRYTFREKGEDFTFGPEDSITTKMAFHLRDGSLAELVYINGVESLVIWNMTDISFEWCEPGDDGRYHIYCEYIIFDYSTMVEEMGDYDIKVAYRGRDLYFSEPCNPDTDQDGVLDGDEINWNSNSDNYASGTREYVELGVDTAYNVRDPDSDNDGVKDGDEQDWNVDEDGLGLDTDTYENMIDPDSDGDGVWDGWEDYFNDYDGDGVINGIDADSDNDGLCDGWADGHIWDPHEGKFISVDSTNPDPIYDPVGGVSGEFDPWEGEDRNRDGVWDPTETVPYCEDSDGDGLWDGYDVVVNGEAHRGELYESGDTEFDTLMNIEGYDYNREYGPEESPVEQSESTDPLDSDTDDDGLPDGFEVSGWGITTTIRYADGEGIEYKEVSGIRTDPTDSDYDGDNLPDGAEFENWTLPYDDDTDSDGLDDDVEITGWETDPRNFDSDWDYLPDGYIEGWRRRGEDDWRVMSGTFVNNTRDPWEGEDLDGDGERDDGESDPTDMDTDNDGIIDGYEYFYDIVFYFIDPGKTVSTNRYCDYDGDGLPNAVDTDSDGDGLNDDDEDVNDNGKLDGTISSGNNYPNYDTASEPNPYDSDSDDDGLEDGEDVKLTDYLQSGEYLYYLADPDNDGLVACMDTDSDNDNTSDKSEIDSGRNPLYYGDKDDDNDGLTYDLERDYGLSDNDPDYDDDGLTDGEEVQIYNTDPKDDDTDNDGMPDKWEAQKGLNPTDENDKYQDKDGDGLLNVDEYVYETDPRNADSDGDNMPDGWEVLWDLSPTTPSGDNDADADGLTDYNEYVLGTNPTSDDTDGDGIKDKDELDGWVAYWYDENGIKQSKGVTSDPTLWDTDNDGLDDGKEYEMKINPESTDTDGDGLSDYMEVSGWFIFCTGKWISTSPRKVDTDGDGLNDGEEWDEGTSPVSSDTDGDRIIDSEDEYPTYVEWSKPEMSIPRIKVGFTKYVLDRFYISDNVGIDRVEISYYACGKKVKSTTMHIGGAKWYSLNVNIEKIPGDFFIGSKLVIKVVDVNGNYVYYNTSHDLKTYLGDVWNNVKSYIKKTVENAVKALISKWPGIAPLIAFLWSMGESLWSNTIGGLIDILKSPRKFVNGLKEFMNVIKKNGIIETVKMMGKSIMDEIEEKIDKLVSYIKDPEERNIIREECFGMFLVGTVYGFVVSLSIQPNALPTKIGTFIKKLGGDAGRLAEIFSKLSSTLEKIKSFLKSVKTVIIKKLMETCAVLKNTVKELVQAGKLSEKTKEVLEKIVKKFGRSAAGPEKKPF
ncbi:MAG: hypothetical protein DRN40_03955, partial [Thermoplasmata archaeon]